VSGRVGWESVIAAQDEGGRTEEQERQREILRAKFRELRDTGDEDLRNELVEAHLGFGSHLARRFAHRGISTDDLEQVAWLGLVKAVDRYDPDRGVEFTSFAAPTVLGEIKRHFRDRGWAVRVPRALQERHLRLNSLVGELTQSLGRSPTIAELAKAAGCSVDEAIEALEAGSSYRSASLDAPVGEDAEGTLVDQLDGEEIDERFTIENRLVVREVLEGMPKRDQLLLRLRFIDDMSQRQIADRLGISQMHVSRLLARSLAALRSHLDDLGAAPPE
jgi:RNA polymerase sigma-B factor